MAPSNDPPPVILFGYASSPFTQKIRLVLLLKRIPYTYVPVPSMLPRPLLQQSLNLSYRKIPVLAIGRELYCDTSLITEALEFFFPDHEGYGTIYPLASDGSDYRALIRGFASYWIDRPLFRATTGLVPSSVWRSSFGKDRAGLIGHHLDAAKLESKLPENLARLDLHLSILEPLLAGQQKTWLIATPSPSLADLSLYYQLQWAVEVSQHRNIEDLSGGEIKNLEPGSAPKGATEVWNAQRYPALFTWYRRLERYLGELEDVEESGTPVDEVLGRMKSSPALGRKSLLLPTPRASIKELERRAGLTEGTVVSVAPDDTGRDSPTTGTLTALSPEEIVIMPLPPTSGPAPDIEMRFHFPRLGFVVRPYSTPVSRSAGVQTIERRTAGSTLSAAFAREDDEPMNAATKRDAKDATGQAEGEKKTEGGQEKGDSSDKPGYADAPAKAADLEKTPELEKAKL